MESMIPKDYLFQIAENAKTSKDSSTERVEIPENLSDQDLEHWATKLL